MKIIWIRVEAGETSARVIHLSKHTPSRRNGHHREEQQNQQGAVKIIRLNVKAIRINDPVRLIEKNG